ncbi:hypothetical protein D8I30_11510 [Brevundimonas naejangsanensis]|uniref:Uncharacterized protein n=1 Tax=Brevundimonas naejangsanensis TaxID=588932 RepID=A0A494RH28_9CAUL|nr:hypothetical protein [Brevundimonas naejangsanensis]AYG95735.1 hypothetical protein D8I30_11510 [Brevundimonas naejangsanensis]
MAKSAALLTAALLTAAALTLTGLGAAGWAAWNSTSAAHGERQAGPTIAIEVVPPREPNLRPGPILSVGELRNGYHHDPERLKGPAASDLPVESAWLEWYPPLPAPTSIIVAVPLEPPPARPPAPTLDRNDYNFGFDAPRPDYAAEREARQSALSKAPPAAPDSIFY